MRIIIIFHFLNRFTSSIESDELCDQSSPILSSFSKYVIPYCNLQKELDKYCARMSRFGDDDLNCPKAEGFEGKMVARFGLNKSGKQVQHFVWNIFDADLAWIQMLWHSSVH